MPMMSITWARWLIQDTIDIDFGVGKEYFTFPFE